MATENNPLNNNECITYLSGGSPVKDAEITYTPANTTEDASDLGSVTITYMNGAVCNSDTNYGLVVIINCDPTADYFANQ